MKTGISIGVGVFQGLMCALALHSLGANSHIFALVVLAVGGASGLFVHKRGFQE